MRNPFSRTHRLHMHVTTEAGGGHDEGGEPLKYPGAVYHVMKRGDWREVTVGDDEHRQRLVQGRGECRLAPPADQCLLRI